MMENIEEKIPKTIQWKFKLIKLLSIRIEEYLLPFFHIEVILDILFYAQILKFSIDYFSSFWFGGNTAIFLYFDISYYLSLAKASTFFSFAVIGVIIMNLYWMCLSAIYLFQYERSNLVSNILQAVYLVLKNIFLLPFTNLMLDLFNCSTDGTIIARHCFEDYSSSFIILVITSFVIFFMFLLGSTYFDFQFIRQQANVKRIRRSGITNSITLIYAVLCQLNNYLFSNGVQLVLLNLVTMILLAVTILNKDEVSQMIKSMQYAFISLQLLAILFLNLSYLVTPALPPFLFLLLSPLLFIAVLQLTTTSLRFELDNINKWPTPQIMISYAGKLRDYLALCDNYTYSVYIHGYMEIHRQKCDNPQCPSRRKLSENQSKLFQRGQLSPQREQLLRCENIIKKIYSDGYKLTPINPELQLEYSIFLYEKKQTELSLRSLLAIKLDRLSFDKLYQLSYLKERIHKELFLQSSKCLDLVSELIVKKEEEDIFVKFERAALLNLQFWSILNEDHPDFQKINEVAHSRIRIRDQIRQNYSRICSIAHSQRVTAFYANYLEAIENDEHMFNEIYSSVKQQFNLENRITLQDWANSSSNIVLVSIDEASFGKIVDINTSCASIMGYQKYELMNQSLKNLFVDDLKDYLKEFTSEDSNQRQFYITHKSGYLIKVIKYCQKFNSIKTGLTAIIRLQICLNPGTCLFLLNKGGKVVGATASIIPLLGIDLKLFESDAISSSFFKCRIEDLEQMAKDKEIPHPIQTIIKEEYLHSQSTAEKISIQEEEFRGSRYRKQFKLRYYPHRKHIAIELHEVIRHGRSSLNYSRTNIFPDFEFKVDASIEEFKFSGASKHEQQNQPSQFNIPKLHQVFEVEQKKQSKYQKGITTLRLRNNVIQIIQSQKEIDLENQNLLNASMANQLLALPRKDQEEIFNSKESFQQFISNYKIGTYAFILIGVGILGVVGLLIGCYALYSYHNNSIIGYTVEIANQHLINGAIAKQSALIKVLQVAANNRSQFSADYFVTTYIDNMNYLEGIQLMGSQPFPIQLKLDQSASQMLSRQYLIAMVNYAYKFTSLLNTTLSAQQMWQSFNSLDSYLRNFLTNGSVTAKQSMHAYIIGRQLWMKSTLENHLKTQAIMLSIGLLYICIYMAFIYLIITRINRERIQIFQIFLEISDIQIQHFSSKSQKLLVSLHVEQANDIEDDQDKKINSSNFAKKKSFKDISFSKLVYIQVLFIPLFFIGYFIHLYGVSSINLNFQLDSIPQFRESAYADFQIYSNLTSLQNAVLNGDSKYDGFQVGSQFRQYYKSYLQVHYNAFGYVSTFHDAWINVFYKDTCPGIMTLFGNTTINQSCSITELSDNGTYAVISNLISLIQHQDFTSPTPLEYMFKFQTISKAHRMITQFLMKAQKDFTYAFEKYLIEIMLIWLFCGIGIIIFWGIPVVRKFIMEINEIKNIISVLPISLAKELPNARKYLHKIIKEDAC